MQIETDYWRNDRSPSGGAIQIMGFRGILEMLVRVEPPHLGAGKISTGYPTRGSQGSLQEFSLVNYYLEIIDPMYSDDFTYLQNFYPDVTKLQRLINNQN